MASNSMSSPEPLVPERDDSWVTEHVEESESKVEDRSPGWTRRPIRFHHSQEEVEAWKQLRDPGYWSRKFKKEEAKKKIASSASTKKVKGEGGKAKVAASSKAGGSGPTPATTSSSSSVVVKVNRGPSRKKKGPAPRSSKRTSTSAAPPASTVSKNVEVIEID